MSSIFASFLSNPKSLPNIACNQQQFLFKTVFFPGFCLHNRQLYASTFCGSSVTVHGLHVGDKHKKGLWSDYCGGGGGGGLHFVFLSVLLLFYVGLFLFGTEFHCLGSVQFLFHFCFVCSVTYTKLGSV